MNVVPFYLVLKGARSNILTVLKHKNTICLQILRKHAKFTYLFLQKTMLQPVILLWNVCSVSECLFLFWSVTPPTEKDLTPQVASLWKTVCCSHANQIADSIWPKNPQYPVKNSVTRGIGSSVVYPQSGIPRERRVSQSASCQDYLLHL